MANLMDNCCHNIADLAVQGQEPQLGTSQQPDMIQPVQPQGQPLGKPLHHTLYKHVPLAIREKAFQGQYVEYKSLLVDPLLPLKNQKLSFVQDPDTGTFEWVEKLSVKDITSFDIWLKAHTVYAAMYLDAHPEQALELVKYQNTIHDVSLWFDWDAVLLYDYHFRQSMSEDPTHSWAEGDPELYTQVFTDCRIGRAKWALGGKNTKNPICHVTHTTRENVHGSPVTLPTNVPNVKSLVIP